MRRAGPPCTVRTVGRDTPWSREDLADAALALGLVALNASILGGTTSRASGALPWVLSFVHALPVATRRRYPRASFALSAGAAGLYLSFGWPMVGLGVASLVLLHTLAATTPRPASLAGLAALVAGMVGLTFVTADTVQPDTLAGNAVVMVAAWALGDSARRRREQAVADQDLTARRAVADERLRIARELHDVVAHSMSVIAVQAGTGRVVFDDDPARALEALAAIEGQSRQALEEMRRLLDVLRDREGGPAALAPVPHLDDLDALVAHAVESGTPVDLRVEGRRRPLPPGVELTAFRIVQEALTNVRKHAPGATARLRLCFEPDELGIEVANQVGPAIRTGPPGLGLVGMRERVALYGGRLDAGREGNGSFRLRASIPLEVQ